MRQRLFLASHDARTAMAEAAQRGGKANIEVKA
jgi:hypothetical protein